ncbi:hypothetical protein AABB24_032689 [Solanum stoloniferum]|uniref:Uncharacterized protein n=1 Tax=Solanum stoloniferum TaxID=62892 RepID=A0ABD2RK39_9SOLN
MTCRCKIIYLIRSITKLKKNEPNFNIIDDVYRSLREIQQERLKNLSSILESPTEKKSRDGNKLLKNALSLSFTDCSTQLVVLLFWLVVPSNYWSLSCFGGKYCTS